jgi:hypothetical protein
VQACHISETAAVHRVVCAVLIREMYFVVGRNVREEVKRAVSEGVKGNAKGLNVAVDSRIHSALPAPHVPQAPVIHLGEKKKKDQPAKLAYAVSLTGCGVP